MTKLYFSLKLISYFIELICCLSLTLIFLYIAVSLSYGINLVETYRSNQEVFNAKIIMYMIYIISVLTFALTCLKIVSIRKFVRNRNGE